MRKLHGLRHDQAPRPLRRATIRVLAAVAKRRPPAVCLVGKTSDFHVEVALGISLDENLDDHPRLRRARSRRRAARRCSTAEHFFDGYKANPGYALACLEGGARRRCALGGALRHQWRHAAGRGRARSPRAVRGRHPRRQARHPCPRRHRNAVANSLAAVDAGARQVQGTLNGLGERCGNANLVTLIPTLVLKSRIRRAASRPASAGRAARADPASAGCSTTSSTARPTGRRPMSAPRPSPTRRACMPARSPKDPRPTSTCRPRAVGNARDDPDVEPGRAVEPA